MGMRLGRYLSMTLYLLQVFGIYKATFLIHIHYVADLTRRF